MTNTLTNTYRKKKFKSTKEEYDFVIIHRINEHYVDLNTDISNINSLELYINQKEKRRAILFDFLQIGKLVNQLSESFISSFNNKHTHHIVR